MDVPLSFLKNYLKGYIELKRIQVIFMRSSHYFFHFIEIWQQLIVIWFRYILTFICQIIAVSLCIKCVDFDNLHTVKLWLLKERNNNVLISLDITCKKKYEALNTILNTYLLRSAFLNWSAWYLLSLQRLTYAVFSEAQLGSLIIEQ